MKKHDFPHVTMLSSTLRAVLVCCIIFISVGLSAQTQAPASSDGRPVRSPQEVARKQTAMLQRELNLTEEQVDTVYKIHLKYAHQSAVSNTRKEVLERMNSMTGELLEVMTKDQQEKFLNKQVDAAPRRSSSSVGRLMRDSIGGGGVHTMNGQ